MMKKNYGLNLPFQGFMILQQSYKYIPGCFSNMTVHRFHISRCSYSSNQNISCGIYIVIFQRCQAVMFHGSTLHVPMREFTLLIGSNQEVPKSGDCLQQYYIHINFIQLHKLTEVKFATKNKFYVLCFRCLRRGV
jgi:hypothetical protein